MMVLGIEVAEIEPVEPGLLELLVKSANLWDGIDLSVVMIVAVDHQGHTVHHALQLPALGQTAAAVARQEIFGITGHYLVSAKLVANEITHECSRSEPARLQKTEVTAPVEDDVIEQLNANDGTYRLELLGRFDIR